MKVAFALTLFSAVLFSAAGDSLEDLEQKIRELHKERIASLKKVVEVTTRLFEDGAVGTSYRDIIQARLLLLNAELDAAESDQERLQVHERIVVMLKEYEAMTEKRLKDEISNMAELLKVKADRLKAEIDLEQAKVKAVIHLK